VIAAVLALGLVQGDASDFVELDVVALDRRDLPVPNLTRGDFEVRDGGARVVIQTFNEVSASGTRVDEERSLVLLMDDVGVPSSGTTPMRQIAEVLLSPTRSADEIAVVRLSQLRDEPFGDVESARDRIAQYHGGALPFSPRETPEMVLRAIRRIASQLEPVEHRRKAIVCLGLATVCNVMPPDAASTSAFTSAWIDAVSGAARANASVYMVDATGLNQRSGPSPVGIVRLTGGAVLGNSNDFAAIAARLWREAGAYYLLGYWAPPSTGRLRAIDVNASRRDVHVLRREYR
jgi:VWFA-related protein